MTTNNSLTKGIVGTGAKFRRIKADNVAINSYFESNKSINPRGGKKTSLFMSKTKKGFARVELYQDLNNDGIVKSNEKIYKGKSINPDSGDELLNFFGKIKLIKTMHKCDWLALKNPDKIAGCTMELIGTSYDLTLEDVSGNEYNFEALGKFSKSSGIVVIETQSSTI